jgi:hypothetical protein
MNYDSKKGSSLRCHRQTHRDMSLRFAAICRQTSSKQPSVLRFLRPDFVNICPDLLPKINKSRNRHVQSSNPNCRLHIVVRSDNGVQRKKPIGLKHVVTQADCNLLRIIIFLFEYLYFLQFALCCCSTAVSVFPINTI